MIQAVVRRAGNIKEALETAAAHRGTVFFLGGGTDLVCKAKDGIVPPSLWVDISGIGDLAQIEDKGDVISIGSLVTHTMLAESPLIKKYAPVLSDAASQVGSPQIRNMGTLGGNAGNASPAADCVTALYTLDAVIHLESPDGKREMAIEEFFKGPGKTVLNKNEIITGFSFPKREGMRGIYMKIGQRQTLSISKVSLALSCRVEGGKIAGIRISLGAVAPTVIHAPKCEAMLEGKVLSEDLIAGSIDMVQMEACPIDDIRSTGGYRCLMTGVLIQRALRYIAEK